MLLNVSTDGRPALSTHPGLAVVETRLLGELDALSVFVEDPGIHSGIWILTCGGSCLNYYQRVE